MMNYVPDHPDIRAAERTGYPMDTRVGRVIATCEECGSDIHEGQEHFSSIDGRLCSEECCRSHFEIKEEDGYDDYDCEYDD